MEAYHPEILRRWMGEKRDGSNEHVDRTTEIAADICGRSQAASAAAKGSEPLGRQERAAYSGQVKPFEEYALKDWALQNQLWIPEKQFSL